jgi:hypothetical protein
MQWKHAGREEDKKETENMNMYQLDIKRMYLTKRAVVGPENKNQVCEEKENAVRCTVSDQRRKAELRRHIETSAYTMKDSPQPHSSSIARSQ